LAKKQLLGQFRFLASRKTIENENIDKSWILLSKGGMLTSSQKD